jgi:O-antigen/teichoic acid export membrane protein
MHPFIQKAAKSFVLRFAGLFLQFAGSVLLASVLGVATYGSYAYAFSWAILAGTIVGLGFGDLAVREVPRYQQRGETERLWGFVVTTLGSILLTGLLAAIVFFVLEETGLVVLGSGWQLAAAVAMIHALVLGGSALMNAFQHIVISQFFETVFRQSLFLGAVLIAFVLGAHLDVPLLFGLSILSAIPVLFIMVRTLMRDIRPADGAWPRPRLEVRFWLTGAIPLMLTMITNQLMTEIDLIIVGLMRDDTAVGLYRVASRGAALLIIANIIGVQVLGPMLSRTLAGGDTAEAQRLITMSALVSAGLGLPLCIGLIVGAQYYLAIFGSEFQPAATVLRILAAAQWLSLMSGPGAMILVLLGRERSVLVITLGALLCNIALNIMLVRNFDIEGAAVSTAIAALIMRTCLLIEVRRHSSFNPTLFRPALLRRAFRRRPGA